MYAPGAATGWYPQQPPTSESSPTPTNNAQANSTSTTAEAASSGWANYSQQYSQYNQYCNQQQAPQPTPSANPQVTIYNYIYGAIVIVKCTSPPPFSTLPVYLLCKLY